jgi:hypothetical protein
MRNPHTQNTRFGSRENRHLPEPRIVTDRDAVQDPWGLATSEASGPNVAG